MKSRDVFTDKLLKRVQELELDLMNEGAITIPPLEWDGSLGPSEVNVIDRLGFLLDAYHARVWYWEIMEMLRKLILTSVLVVIYNGSAPHLFASLLTTFIFILAHLRVHPYLNRRLNNFQRLALITQFLTILGGIIYLLMQTLNELHEVSPGEGDQMASYLLALFILGINWLTGVVYPMYRVLLLVMSSELHFSATIAKYFGRLSRSTGVNDDAANDKPLELVNADDMRRAQILLQQDVRGNRSQTPRLRQRVRAPAPAALPQEHQDEIQADQHQSTQGRASVATVSFLL